MLVAELLLALLTRMQRLRDALRVRLGLPPLRRPVSFGSTAALPRVGNSGSTTAPPILGAPAMTPSQMLQRAFGPERAARYEADAAVLGAAFPAPEVPALASALLPDNWGSVRDVFAVLKKRGEAGLAAVPTLAAWLLVAPSRVGRAEGYLTGWEAYALAEGWYALAALNKELRRAADRVGEDRVGAALAGLIELCDGPLVEEAARVLAGPDGQAQRGAVDFLGTAVGAAERARAALLTFARTPAPPGEAGLGYARGEAIRAWSALTRFAPPEAPPEVPPGAAPASPPLPAGPAADSWAGRLAAFRALLAQPDLGPAREAARALLLAGPPPTPAGVELREAAVGLLARPGVLPVPPAAALRPPPDELPDELAFGAGAPGAGDEGDEGDAGHDAASGGDAEDAAASRGDAEDTAAEDAAAEDTASEDTAARRRPVAPTPAPRLAGARGTPTSSAASPAGSSAATARVFTHLRALASPGQPAAVRVSALESLTRRFPHEGEVVDLLCLAAEDEDEALRLAAARLFGEL